MAAAADAAASNRNPVSSKVSKAPECALIPDVAYDANPNTGVAVYDSFAVNGQSGWIEIGGTSAVRERAAPFAIADQGRALTSQNTIAGGQSNLYKLPSTDFHDVSTGSNGYSATTGYDLVTGLGSPVASSVVATWWVTSPRPPVRRARPGRQAPRAPRGQATRVARPRRLRRPRQRINATS